MQFDDRLDTVLRTSAGGEAAARTQYRQLIDLMGSTPSQGEALLTGGAFERLETLAQAISPDDQARILRDPGLRLRNRHLAQWLAHANSKVSAAAMANARLTQDEWLDLIPRVPITARGFLRHRRDLPARALELLERLGIGDLVLTGPQDSAPIAEAPQRQAAPAIAQLPEDGITALRQRIDAFQQAREQSRKMSKRPTVPPKAENSADDLAGVRISELDQSDFATDRSGEIIWADPWAAPMLVGMKLGANGRDATARLCAPGMRMMERRQPLRAATLRLDAAPAISGDWWVDAAPLFDTDSGHFNGYAGRLRRQIAAAETVVAPASEPLPMTADSPADRMRQMLHELRTPVNAIQGFAEIIQQQIFGHVPGAYRALAAAIGVDSARLLAGFDEIDRLARLESGHLELDEGQCDWREIITGTLQRLDEMLRPREAGFDLSVTGSPFTLNIDRPEALGLAWRVLATMAGALGPGEKCALKLTGDGALMRLDITLPVAWAQEEDIFRASAPVQGSAVTAGMFGHGFALRLAREEAKAAGGSLEMADDRLRITLPNIAAPLDRKSARP